MKIMDLFKEDKIIFETGGQIYALAWSITAFILIILSDTIFLFISTMNLILALILSLVLPNIILLVIYYFALKHGIKKFKLNNYTLRVEYLAIITILTYIYSAILTYIGTGQIEILSLGILPLIIMFIIAYLVKK